MSHDPRLKKYQDKIATLDTFKMLIQAWNDQVRLESWPETEKIPRQDETLDTFKMLIQAWKYQVRLES